MLLLFLLTCWLSEITIGESSHYASMARLQDDVASFYCFVHRCFMGLDYASPSSGELQGETDGCSLIDSKVIVTHANRIKCM